MLYYGKAKYIGQEDQVGSIFFEPNKTYKVCIKRRKIEDLVCVFNGFNNICIPYNITFNNELGACKYWKRLDGTEIFETKV